MVLLLTYRGGPFGCGSGGNGNQTDVPTPRLHKPLLGLPWRCVLSGLSPSSMWRA